MLVPGAAAALLRGDGRRLGPYQLAAQIAVGRRTITHVAGDAAGGHLALRVLREDVAPEQLAAELAAAGGPLVGAPASDLVELDGVWAVPTKLIAGESLATVLADAMARREPLPLSVALTIASGVAERLARLDGGVHGDLLPQHVLLGWDGAVELIDPAGRGRPRAEPLWGGYRSPEQVRGDALAPGSDVFSLGILVFEMTTATRLFAGSDPAAQAAQILEAHLPRPRELVGDSYPIELQLVLRKLLRPALAGRFADGRAALEALRLVSGTHAALPLGLWLEQRFPERREAWRAVLGDPAREAAGSTAQLRALPRPRSRLASRLEAPATVEDLRLDADVVESLRRRLHTTDPGADLDGAEATARAPAPLQRGPSRRPESSGAVLPLTARLLGEPRPHDPTVEGPPPEGMFEALQEPKVHGVQELPPRRDTVLEALPTPAFDLGPASADTDRGPAPAQVTSAEPLEEALPFAEASLLDEPEPEPEPEGGAGADNLRDADDPEPPGGAATVEAGAPASEAIRADDPNGQEALSEEAPSTRRGRRPLGLASAPRLASIPELPTEITRRARSSEESSSLVHEESAGAAFDGWGGALGDTPMPLSPERGPQTSTPTPSLELEPLAPEGWAPQASAPLGAPSALPPLTSTGDPWEDEVDPLGALGEAWSARVPEPRADTEIESDDAVPTRVPESRADTEIEAGAAATPPPTLSEDLVLAAPPSPTPPPPDLARDLVDESLDTLDELDAEALLPAELRAAVERSLRGDTGPAPPPERRATEPAPKLAGRGLREADVITQIVRERPQAPAGPVPTPAFEESDGPTRLTARAEGRTPQARLATEVVRDRPGARARAEALPAEKAEPPKARPPEIDPAEVAPAEADPRLPARGAGEPIAADEASAANLVIPISDAELARGARSKRVALVVVLLMLLGAGWVARDGLDLGSTGVQVESLSPRAPPPEEPEAPGETLGAEALGAEALPSDIAGAPLEPVLPTPEPEALAPEGPKADALPLEPVLPPAEPEAPAAAPALEPLPGAASPALGPTAEPAEPGPPPPSKPAAAPPPPRAAPSPRPPRAPRARAEARPAEAAPLPQVRVRVLPSEAQISVDGKPLANGASLEVGPRPKRIVASAPGYEAATRVVQPSERSDVLLLLKKAKDPE